MYVTTRSSLVDTSRKTFFPHARCVLRSVGVERGDVTHLLSTAGPALMCGGGMLLMVVMMTRGSRDSNGSSSSGATNNHDDPEVGELRQEVARLRAELGERREPSARPPNS